MVSSLNISYVGNISDHFSANFTDPDCCNTTNISSNDIDLSTKSDYEIIVTKFITWFALLVMIASVFINGLCLIAFYKEKRLRTVFNSYLICLTIADFLYASISMPSFIIMNYYGFWPLGQNFCAFYLWSDLTFSAAVQSIVMLIGIDRVWALYWPFAYRRHRGPKVTSSIIAGMWLMLLSCITPGIVINRLTSTDPLVCEVGMDTPGKQAWAIFVNFINYIVPQIVLIVCFALMAVKIQKQSRIRTGRPNPDLTVNFRQPNEVLVSHTNQEQPNTAQLHAEARAAKDRRLFRMMGYLTLAMFVCWMPGNVFWTMYDVDASVYNFSFAMTVTLMMFMNSVTNPLLYQTGSNEMRRVLMGMLRIPPSKGSAANRNATLLYSTLSSSQKRQQPTENTDGQLIRQPSRNRMGINNSNQTAATTDC